MKKNKALFSIVFLAVISGGGFALTKPDVKDFDVSIFDYHFSRADRELSPEAWMTEARRGMIAALGAWELIAPDLYDDPLLREEAVKAISQWGEAEMENRFTQWLHRRFFGGEAGALAEKMSGLIGNIHLQYTYHQDEEGNIVYDDETGDPSVIRPQEGRDFAVDREQWRNAAERGLREKTEAVEEHIALWYPELLAFIPENRREEFAGQFQSIRTALTFNLRREFEGLVNREERLFTARRTGDIWSLRKKSDDEAAGVITARIIEETETICANGIASLTARIEEAAAGGGDLALAGTEWLEAYRVQFERGLKAWEDAEERFFIRRIEWEQDAGKTFLDGEEAWSLAFNQFENACRTWEQQARELFESGEAVFKKASANLESAIAEAKAEFEGDAQLRMEAGTGRAQAWVDMYITSGSVITAARENIRHWLTRYQSNEVLDPADERFGIWLDNEIEYCWNGAQQQWEQQNDFQANSALLKELEEAANNKDLTFEEKLAAGMSYQVALIIFHTKHAVWFEIQDAMTGKFSEDEQYALIEKLKGQGFFSDLSIDSLLEVKRWFSLYNSYFDKALEARKKLIYEFNMVMGSGSLADILSEGAASEDFNLDEYQIELIRAKAVAAYWEKRVAIAEAVSAYAGELTAGRMTDGEGIRAWETAKAAYDESVALYEAEQQRLENAGAAVRDAEAALNAAAAKIKEADSELKKLNQQYASLMAVYAAGHGSHVLNELWEKYQNLLAEHELLDDPGPQGAYIRYLERGLELGFARGREQTGELLKTLITGNDDNEEKSLAELKQAAEQIKVLAEDEDLPKTLDEYGLAADDPHYDLILRLLAGRDREIAGAAELFEEDPELLTAINSRYGEMIRLQMKAAKTAAETALEIRLQGLRLFTAESGADWYFGAWGYVPPEPEKAALAEKGLTQRLTGDVEKIRLHVLKARLSLETEALHYYLNGTPKENTPENPEAKLLSFFCTADRDAAEQGLVILEALLDRLNRGLEQFTDNDDENMIIAWFVSEGSFFEGAGGFLTEPLNEYNRALGLLDLYETYGYCSFFGEKENWERAVQGLRNFFSAYGIKTEEACLPDVKTAATALFNQGGDTALLSAELLNGLDSQFALIPAMLEPELTAWKNSLITYMAARAVSNGRGMGRNTTQIRKEQEEIQGRYAALQEIYLSLAFADDRVIGELNRQYETLRERELVLSYAFTIAAEYEKIVQDTSNAEEEGRKHWRQYVSREYIKDAHQTGAASSWKEGVLLDALDAALRNTERVNKSFLLYAGQIEKQTNVEWQSVVEPYLQDQKTAWDEEIITRTPYLLLDNYYLEAGNIQRLQINEESIREEIAVLGLGYDFSRKDTAVLKKELENELQNIEAMEDYLQSLALAYSLAADKFLKAGGAYDNQYTRLKESYAEMEEKRFHYETQDAIRRWAGTAYLEAEIEDLEYSKASLKRAQAALTALSNLYNNNEERRPYDDEEYEKLYRAYAESFDRMMVSLKAQDTLNKAVMEELQRNAASYTLYTNNLGKFGKPMAYAGYSSPSERAAWNIKDIITVKNGLLAFSRDNNMVLHGVDGNTADKLSAYFQNDGVTGLETNPSSPFERALREMNGRMLLYMSDTRKYQQWGLARDYLIRQLIQANSGIEYLAKQYNTAEALKRNQNLGELPLRKDLWGNEQKLWKIYEAAQEPLSELQRQAWENMSAAERADLEFYIILTLTGGGSDMDSAFAYMSALEEYNKVYERVNHWYKIARDRANHWWKGGFLYNTMRDINRTAEKRTSASRQEIKKRVEQGQENLSFSLGAVSSALSAYTNSCARLAVLQGKGEKNTAVTWEDINKSLIAAGGLNRNEIEKMRGYWKAMNEDIKATYADVSEALARLSQWTRSTKEDNKRNLEYQWMEDELERQRREAVYRKAADVFTAAGGDIKDLTADMTAAFGKEAAGWKNHLENLEAVLANDLGGLVASDSAAYLAEYTALANEYTALISRAYGMRYNAELAAREAEWAQQRKDIEEKYRMWQDTAALILERGREDWKTGSRKMINAYDQWSKAFTGEYNRISEAWAGAYLEGLRDKEKWLASAEGAAEKASSEAFVALVGADAEMMARSMDTRDPVGEIVSHAGEEAGTLLETLLNAAGIVNLNDAFTALYSGAGTAAVKVRRGLGGIGVWDAGAAQNAAMNLARETNAELAVREAKKLAVQARDAAAAALRALAESVNDANQNFRKSMDEMFIMGGQWRRSEKKYIKDIITHSTLFQPVITERETVEGYVDYTMEPVDIKTNLNENYLTGLNEFAIQGLIQNVYEEVEAAANEIFGTGKERELIKKQIWVKKNAGFLEIVEELVTLEDRYQEPGEFGAHIGYRPVMRPNPSFSSGKGSVFYDQGSGELGRLMTEYIFWERQDLQGIGELSRAAWDKPLFYVSDDFSAPSLRTLAEISTQVVTMAVSAAAATVTGGTSLVGMAALMTAINVSDDLVFNAMDIAGGYKSWDEAGFEFGKSLVLSAASSSFSIAGTALTGAVVGKTTDALGKTLVKTTIKGLEVAATGTVTSALSGVTYDQKNGWGYSAETFFQGMQNLPGSVVSAMASTLTREAMGVWNSGSDNSKLVGFSNSNKKNLDRLNGLIGGLAGEGASYAAGGDFTLNLLNLNLISGGKIDGGLLELHLGREGAKINVGTGGADVSLGTLAGAVQGGLVWGTNSKIHNYVEENEFKNAVTLRAQYGFGDKEQQKQLWNILSGQDEIRTNLEGGFDAKTEKTGGKRIIYLNGYRDGMSPEEQMYLAVVLGHEAYRNGYKTGDINDSGNPVKAVDNFGELYAASVAKITMGDRINRDYDWFYDLNTDLAFESYLWAETNKTGNSDVFQDYLRESYVNDEDYYWKWANTNGDFQNLEKYRDMPLLNAKTRSQVNSLNKQNLEKAFKAYKQDLAQKEGYTGDLSSFVTTNGLTGEQLAANFNGNSELQKKFGYTEIKFESVYLMGCMLMSAIYGAEAVTEKDFDVAAVNKLLKEKNLYLNDSDLSKEKMAEIISFLSDGDYKVGVAFSGIPTINQILEFRNSEDMYLSHIRIKKNGTGAAYHSAMVGGLDYSYDRLGRITGLRAIQTANPWNGDGNVNFTAKTALTMDQIARWDVFKVTPALQYYKKEFFKQYLNSLTKGVIL
ncbi:MAG: hypothetical protein LBG10_01575 [Treponema sp.]|jgi:hypothetical protein|nr:hypothetical protein [Treponema sp.]